MLLPAFLAQAQNLVFSVRRDTLHSLVMSCDRLGCAVETIATAAIDLGDFFRKVPSGAHGREDGLETKRVTN